MTIHIKSFKCTTVSNCLDRILVWQVGLWVQALVWRPDRDQISGQHNHILPAPPDKVLWGQAAEGLLHANPDSQGSAVQDKQNQPAPAQADQNGYHDTAHRLIWQTRHWANEPAQLSWLELPYIPPAQSRGRAVSVQQGAERSESWGYLYEEATAKFQLSNFWPSPPLSVPQASSYTFQSAFYQHVTLKAAALSKEGGTGLSPLLKKCDYLSLMIWTAFLFCFGKQTKKPTDIKFKLCHSFYYKADLSIRNSIFLIQQIFALHLLAELNSMFLFS